MNNLTKSISFFYKVNKDTSIINDKIFILLNTNGALSDKMKKINIYRTEFYNLFHNDKTKWLIDNGYIRLYIKEDFEELTHYIPIGIIRKAVEIENVRSTSNEFVGSFKADIYPEITDRFEDLFTSKGLNTDKYSIGYVSYNNDILAITLKHINKFESKDKYDVYCLDHIKFASKYIEDNELE